MKLAYKAFSKDLSCTAGGNHYQYKLNVWNEEPEANCRQNGFHCAENPLDCLNYYPNMDNSVYYMVIADGELHEDGTDTKISCTKLRLLKELTIERFVAHGLNYYSDHPHARFNCKNCTMDKGIANDKFIIVRGLSPIAKGDPGTVLGFLKENPDGEITELGIYTVDGNNIMPNTWYDIEGNMVSP